jgi:two-component system chemotaxis response regulator CheY
MSLSHGKSTHSSRKDDFLRILIAEDDSVTRLLMRVFLKKVGSCHLAVNGKEAVEAARKAIEAFNPYDLICLDIMMPEMDGQQALKAIRTLEKTAGIKGAKIIMTTAVSDEANVLDALREQCDGFLVKPIWQPMLLDRLREFDLIR